MTQNPSLKRLALLLALSALPAWADVSSSSPPATPPGQRMAALLQVFAGATPSAARTFFSENFAESALKEVPAERRSERLLGIAEEQGPLEFIKVIQGAGLDVSFLAHSNKTGDWLEISLMLEPAPSYRIRAIRLGKTDGPGTCTISAATPASRSCCSVASKRNEIRGCTDA